MSKPSSTDRELRELLKRFAHCVADGTVPADCFKLDEESSELGARILVMLGPGTGLDSPEELWSMFGRFVKDRDDPREEELDRLLAGLREPPTTFSICVELGPSGNDSFACWLGGPHRLDLALDFYNRPGLWLLGEVRARTREGAVLQVEHLIDAYLGASYVLGLIRYLPRRTEMREDDCNFLLWDNDGLDAAHMSAAHAERLHRSIPVMPRDLSDLERVQVSRDERDRAVGRHYDLLRRVLAGASPDAQLVRNSCRHAISAVASTDLGVLATLAFSAMEGLLLSPTSTADTLAGLREAIAHTFGTSLTDRDRLRKLVKELYEVRSVFVHTGQVQEQYRARQEILALMRGVLRVQIEKLPRLEPEPRPPPDKRFSP